MLLEQRQPQWYNLWYEWPTEERGSDTYRGYWGTLMQLIISNGMYDKTGLSYVNQSFKVDDFGFNTYSVSGMPKRWSSFGTGSGYSDHLPLSMIITKAKQTLKVHIVLMMTNYGNLLLWSIRDLKSCWILKPLKLGRLIVKCTIMISILSSRAN